VVAFGPTRVLHVFMTAAEGHLARHQDEFERVLNSIQEEG
jgi:hypothetical protein